MIDITPRERIIEATNHRITDQLPIDFGAMRSTGISVLAYNKLKKYLNMDGNSARMYDVFQQLAEPEIQLLDRLGGDVVQAHRLCPAWGIKIDSWKPWILQDGSKCLVPSGYNPIQNEKGDYELRDGEVVLAKMPKNGLYFDQVIHRYENVQSEDDIDNIQINEINDEEADFIEAQVINYYKNTDRAITLSFGGNILEMGQLEWGYEKFYMSLALEPDLVHYWLDKLTCAYVRDLEKILSRVGKYIQVIIFGDDLGTQEAPQISVKMYRDMIKPYHSRQYQYVKNNYPNVKVFLHSCGAIYDLIPDLIDAGVEILNPVQISAKGMDPLNLKKEYGKYLTFWGGGADMQGRVNTGNIEQIKRDVKELIEIFSPDGGFVFTQVHNILADVPPEKIMTIYDTALNFRKNQLQAKI